MSHVQGDLRGQAIALMERVLRDGGPIAPEYPLGLDARFGGRIVTIEEEGRVLSACAVLVRDFVIGTLSLRCGLIGSVCTAPEARGRGLATELLRRAEAELASEGCMLAMLWADEARFYDERGWRPIGAEVDFAFDPAQETRLAGESGIRAAALDDRGAIHRLYTLHRERVERSPQETAALLSSPGIETLVLQRERDVVAYSCRGRGKDFDRTVHEWAGSDRDVLALVHATMTLLENLGLASVAEGVETAAQLELLKQMGCEFGQGFYFSRPVAAPIAEAMIARQTATASWQDSA